MRASPLILLALLSVSTVGEAASDLSRDADAYKLFPPLTSRTENRSYTIGPLDTIAVTVFQEPDLTVRDLPVDAGGKIVLPLIGSVQAAGFTATQLARNIEKALAKGLLVNPQVSVVVQNAISQKVTVQGSVMEPGIYQLQGPTTLMDALAMAKGPTRVASLGEVAVFREVDGKRVGALFNVKKISKGEQADPEILGSDTVVVGSSGVKAAWRDILTASPLAAAIRPF
jgi:polysaccharide export outer membrane protein